MSWRVWIAMLILGGAVLVGSMAVAAENPEADVFVARGILEYDEKNYPEALRLFQEALRLEPDNLDAMYYTSLVYITREKYADAADLLETARAKDPNDVNILYQLGVAYFRQMQYDKADPLFRQVAATDPKRENLGYYLGFIRYERKDYAGAITFFKQNVSSDPTVGQLTAFYTGLAAASLGLGAQARAEMEEAIRLDPLSPIVAPAQRVRETIAAARAAEERPWRLTVRVNTFYDSNVRVLPTEHPDDPVVTTLRNNKTRSTGNLFTVGGEYDVLKTEHQTVTGGYTFLQTLNHSLPDFNIQDHLAYATYAYRNSWRDLPYFTGVQYAYDFLVLESRKFAQRNSVTAFGSLIENAGNLTSVTLRYQFKDFFNERALIAQGVEGPENRDAHNVMVGFMHFFRFQADRHQIRLGYQFDDEAARGQNWRYYGNRLIAGFRYSLPEEIRLDVGVEYHDRFYDHTNTIYGKRRHDFDQNYTASLSRDLPWVRLGTLTASLDYLFNNNNSTIPVFHYMRHVVSLGLTWRY